MGRYCRSSAAIAACRRERLWLSKVRLKSRVGILYRCQACRNGTAGLSPWCLVLLEGAVTWPGQQPHGMPGIARTRLTRRAVCGQLLQVSALYNCSRAPYVVPHSPFEHHTMTSCRAAAGTGCNAFTCHAAQQSKTPLPAVELLVSNLRIVALHQKAAEKTKPTFQPL